MTDSEMSVMTVARALQVAEVGAGGMLDLLVTQKVTQMLQNGSIIMGGVGGGGLGGERRTGDGGGRGRGGDGGGDRTDVPGTSHEFRLYQNNISQVIKNNIVCMQFASSEYRYTEPHFERACILSCIGEESKPKLTCLFVKAHSSHSS